MRGFWAKKEKEEIHKSILRAAKAKEGGGGRKLPQLPDFFCLSVSCLFLSSIDKGRKAKKTYPLSTYSSPFVSGWNTVVQPIKNTSGLSAYGLVIFDSRSTISPSVHLLCPQRRRMWCVRVVVLTPFSPPRSLGDDYALSFIERISARLVRLTLIPSPSKSLSDDERRVLFFLFFQILSFAGNRQDDEISKVGGGGRETRVSTGLSTPLLFRSSDWDLCLLVFPPPSMSISSANPFSTFWHLLQFSLITIKFFLQYAKQNISLYL